MAPLGHVSFQMKACHVLLLATVALAAITSAANIRKESLDVEDTRARVDGRLKWLAAGAENQHGEIR